MTDLLTLKDAAARFFGGTVTVAYLQKQARNGRLEIYRIGNRDWTTPEAIQRMVEQCRVIHEDRTLAYARSRDDRPSGISGMVSNTALLDAARKIANGLKASSHSTSPAGAPKAAVIRLKSRLPRS